MARRRNYQWPAATRFEGSITQDKVGGSTQSVTPEIVEARLIEDGFVLDTDLPAPSSAAPQDLGATNSGSSNDYSRADHRHKMPTLTDIGAVALGETSATAYRGDRGKAAYDHTLATANAHPIGAITGLDAALAAKLPFVDLTTSPSALDFNATGVTGSYIAACDWSRPAVQAHAPYGPVGYGTLIHIDKGSVISQVFFSAGDYAPSSIAQVYTRTFWSGVWGAWSGLWGAGNLVGTRNEHNHDSVITKSASYDFTGITASLIKHTNGDVVATLSGGVPGRSYTLVSVAALLILIPPGVTLHGTSGIWDNSTGFSLGGMRPITIQCLSSTEWLIPSYGE